MEQVTYPIVVKESKAHQAAKERRKPFGRRFVFNEETSRLALGTSGENGNQLAATIGRSLSHRNAGNPPLHGLYDHESEQVAFHGSIDMVWGKPRLFAALCRALKDHGVPDVEVGVVPPNGVFERRGFLHALSMGTRSR